MTPDQARTAARQALGDMARGINLNYEKKRQQINGMTLGDCYSTYVQERTLTKNTKRDYEKAMRTGFKAWKDLPVSRITRDLVIRRFDELSIRSPAQANQMFRFLRALLNFSMERFRSAEGEPLIPSNPCNALKALARWNRIPARTRYIPLPRLPALLGSLMHDSHDTKHRNDIKDFCACLLLTGCREQEIAALRWSNVNLMDGTLTIPVTKNGDSHTLPMGTWLLSVMRRRKLNAATSATTSMFVFPAGTKEGHLKNHRKGLRAIAKAAGIAFTPHDLRRTFATIASEKLGGERSYFLVARLLNHRKSDVTSQYVQVPISSLRAAMQTIEDAIVGTTADIGLARA
jgi:integrase